jgi:uncharacterized membrane protein YuzA (DUF378 family)
MMMNSPFCHFVGKAAWVITALAAINQGLTVFDFNIFMTDFFMNNLTMLFVPLHLLIGIAGVFSFVHLFTKHSHN